MAQDTRRKESITQGGRRSCPMRTMRRLQSFLALALLPAATLAQDALISFDASVGATRTRGVVPTYQILDIGTLGGAGTAANDLNDAGQITGASGAGDSSHAFVYAHGEMVDLGTLGGSGSSGSALNESGEVTGSSETVEGLSHAFLYSNGKMLDLGSVGGGNSVGNDINNAGQVTGYSWKPEAGEYYAFLYSNGQTRDLGTLGDSYSTGLAINDAGEVAGYYQRQFESHAFLYRDGAMNDIVPSGFSFIRSPLGQPVNAAGHVAGSYRPSGPNRAFLFRDGAAIDLGTLGGGALAGQVSDGFAINDADEVTGYSTTSTGEYHAFLWSQGAMQDLGTLGGDFSLGYAINSSGQVTGTSSTESGPQYPFVYAGGRMVLLDIGALGGYYGYGTDINSSGQVLGTYFKVVQNEPFEDEIHAFLATPITLLFSQLLAKTEGVGPGRLLSDTVRAAAAYYAVPDLPPTCLVLRGFAHGVAAQAGQQVAQQTADELIADAEAIETALGCRINSRRHWLTLGVSTTVQRFANRHRENEVRVVELDGKRRLQQYRRLPQGFSSECVWVDVAELRPRP